jgi:hypothetical protein
MDFGRIEGKEARIAKLMLDKGYDFSSLTGFDKNLAYKSVSLKNYLRNYK